LRKADVGVAKNYLGKDEIDALNVIVGSSVTESRGADSTCRPCFLKAQQRCHDVAQLAA